MNNSPFHLMWNVTQFEGLKPVRWQAGGTGLLFTINESDGSYLLSTHIGDMIGTQSTNFMSLELAQARAKEIFDAT